MNIDSHGLYSLEPASPVYRVIQAHLSRLQSGFIPGHATRQSKGSFGQVSEQVVICGKVEGLRVQGSNIGDNLRKRQASRFYLPPHRLC